MTLEIREVPLGGKLHDFLNVVDYIYRDDPNYVRPLDLDLKARLSRKNPFFEHADGTMFLAYRNGFCVGRISAQICRAHLARHKDDAGFFGFFDTIDNAEVAKALIARASRWLSDRGMKRIRGPLSWNLWEEAGCLVEGFDSPPMLMMPHHRPYQGGLIEAAGLTRVRTLCAWKYEVGNVSRRVRKAHEDVAAMPEVMARPINMRNLEADVRIVMDIFNDGWSDHYGIVPYTAKELDKLAADFKLILRPEITCIVFVNGLPAAFAVAVPNINEAIRDLNGKLLPTGLFKLLYRMKVERPETARLAFLGIKKEFRQNRRYAGLSLYLYARLNDAGYRLGIRWGELSWTDEANSAVAAGIKLMGGVPYKKYAIYEREL